jgi:acyl carrier protein phosphodiesterase
MNHLAHCFLADVAQVSIAGSMAGDFVRGPLSSAVESSPRNEFAEGVRFHRIVDSFTDDHPVVARSKARLPEPYRRYAGVLVDVYFDHCLARHWSEFAAASLEEFAVRVAREIEAHRSEFPHRAGPFLEFFLRTNLLLSYRERDGIARALMGMSRRIRHPNPLASAMGELEAHSVPLEADFLEFFPEAMAMAKRIGGAA